MERRALLAAVLCLLVLLVYQEAIRRFYPPPATPEVPEVVVPSPPAEFAGEAPLAPAHTPRTESAPRGERVIAIDTDLYAARVTTAGGRIVSFRLKNYRTSIEQSSEPLEMIQVSGGAPPPLGARFLADAKVEDDTSTLYAADRDALTLAGDEAGVVTLTGTLPSGAHIEKTLAFKGDAYPVTVTLRSDLPASFSRAGMGWRQHASHAPSKDPEAHYRGAVVLVDKKVVHELVTAMPPGSQNRFDAAVGWA